jgi:hypothetical protein
LQHDVEIMRGASRLVIDAAQLTWASPLDLAAIAVVASSAAELGIDLALPSDRNVAQYLARMNVVSIVEELGGSVAGPSTLPPANALPDRLIEVRQMQGSADVALFGSDVYKLVALHATNSVAAVFHTMLGELLTNTVDHAVSRVGAFGAAQVHSGVRSGRPGVEVAIADAGVGILQSLRRNPDYAGIVDCAEGIRTALRRGVSSEVGDPNRGNGLSRVTHQLRAHRARLVLRSGDGLARVSPGGRRISTTMTSTPGTWAWLWVDLAVSHADAST